MKKIFAAIIILFHFVLNVNGQTFDYENDFPLLQNRSLDSNDSMFYPSLLKRFISKDTTLTNYEVLGLLIGFTCSPNYDPYSDLDIERRIFDLNHKKDYARALLISDTFLIRHPVNQSALIEASYSHFKLKNKNTADDLMWRFGKIILAMASTGNGLSPESPIFSLGPADGQNYIQKYLRQDLGSMGSTRNSKGRFIDVLEMIPKNGGEPVKLYFIIDHSLVKFRKEIEKKLNQNQK